MAYRAFANDKRWRDQLDAALAAKAKFDDHSGGAITTQDGTAGIAGGIAFNRQGPRGDFFGEAEQEPDYLRNWAQQAMSGADAFGLGPIGGMA